MRFFRFSSSDKYFEEDQIKSDLKKHSIRGVGATFFSQSFTYCIQLVSTFIIARILTPDDFGVVAMVISIFQFFMMYRTLGLLDATIQTDNINHKLISTLFWINLTFGLILSLLLIGIAPIIAWFYGEPKLKAIAISLSVVLLFGGAATQHMALIKRNMEFYKAACVEIIAAILSITFALTLAINDYGYWALVARHIVLAGSIFVGYWLICPWRPGLPSFGNEALSMIKFGMNMLGSYSLTYFAENLDKILIGWRYGSHSLGNYDRAYQLFLAPSQRLTFPMTHVAVSTLGRLKKEPEKYCRYYIKSFSFLAFIGFPISAVLTVSGVDIILLLLGPQWSEAANIFSIFGLTIGIHMLYSTNGWLHISMGRSDRWLKWGIISALVTCCSFIIGLSWGALGVAIAYTTSMYLMIIPALWYAGGPINLKISSLLSSSWKFYISAFCAGFITWYLTHMNPHTSEVFSDLNILIRLTISTSMCTISYLFLVITLYQSTKPISDFIILLKSFIQK